LKVDSDPGLVHLSEEGDGVFGWLSKVLLHKLSATVDAGKDRISKLLKDNCGILIKQSGFGSYFD